MNKTPDTRKPDSPPQGPPKSLPPVRVLSWPRLRASQPGRPCLAESAELRRPPRRSWKCGRLQSGLLGLGRAGGPWRARPARPATAPAPGPAPLRLHLHQARAASRELGRLVSSQKQACQAWRSGTGWATRAACNPRVRGTLLLGRQNVPREAGSCPRERPGLLPAEPTRGQGVGEGNA